MNFHLSKEHLELVEEVAMFREEELMPLEPAFLQRGRWSANQRTKLEESARSRGLWALDVPKEFGGRCLDEFSMCLVSEEIAKHPAMFTFGGSPEPCLYECSDEQRRHYLWPIIEGERHSAYAFTEREAGSDLAALTTTATRVPGGWTLNGSKTLVAYIERADFVIVFATINPAERSRSVTCFLVDRNADGMRVSDPIPNMGDDWETHDIEFVDCRLPESAVLGGVGEGWRLADDLLNHGRLRIAAYQLGIAQRCLDIAMNYARTRYTWGKPLASRQSIQWMISDSEVELRAARLLVYEAAWRVDQTMRTRAGDLAAKLFATEMAQRVADRALQILGGIGYGAEYPVQSFYRQVRAWRIGHGSSEISRNIIARELLGDCARF